MTTNEQMAAWVAYLKALDRKALYDFGWHLEEVIEPSDERRIND
jgi:hypothetical protein